LQYLALIPSALPTLKEPVTRTATRPTCTPIFVGDDGKAGGLAAGVEADPDGLNLAHDTVRQADPKR
jgi:hypothetical protein